MNSTKTHALCATTLFWAVALGCAESGPNDDELLRWFRDSRGNLELLAGMSNDDYRRTKVTRIAPTFTRLSSNWGWPRPESEWGISRARWREYNTLFERVGLRDGLNRDGDGDWLILFPFWGSGFLDSTRQTGVLYADGDVASTECQRQRFEVRQIEGAWYIYRWATW